MIKAGKEEVKWQQWEKVGDGAGKGHCRIQKITTAGPMKQCIEQLCQELVALPRHGFNHRWQIKRYQALMQDTHAVVNR